MALKKEGTLNRVKSSFMPMRKTHDFLEFIERSSEKLGFRFLNRKEIRRLHSWSRRRRQHHFLQFQEVSVVVFA